ncbi:hypothetical protein G6F61_015136 [Rhizopus arrhizus]|nr:hypothetical protein G6F61_015136 [Rhizopus arrhizus]
MRLLIAAAAMCSCSAAAAMVPCSTTLMKSLREVGSKRMAAGEGGKGTAIVASHRLAIAFGDGSIVNDCYWRRQARCYSPQK